MLKTLLPYISLYKRYLLAIILGLSLAVTTLAASVFLLSLSGWFLASTAFVGVAGLFTFNYMLPAAGVRGAAILRTTARYFERLVNHNTTFKILAYLRTLAFKKILPLSDNQLEHYQKADLLNRFIADIDHLDHLYLKLFSPIITALIIIGLLFVGLSLLNLQIALVITLVLGITILVVPIVFYQMGKQLGAKLAQQKSQYRQQLVNYLQGQAELTLFNARNTYRTQLDMLEDDWLNNQKIQSRLVGLSSALIALIVGLLTLVVLGLIASVASSPMIALFVFVTLSSAEILAPIPGAFIFLGEVLTSAKRTTNLFNQQPAIAFIDKGQHISLTSAKLQIDNVTFCYPSQPLQILHDFSLTILPGEHIGLIGQTGCGKSTLLDLITRSRVPDKGHIYLNDVELNQLTDVTLRQAVGIVPQVITIFSDTLRENLLIGNPNATDHDLIRVIEQVGLKKLLLNDGLDLWLGEGGRPLSGGERRRIGIARALLHNAPLILMDEPTESLDSQTEQQMMALIKQHCLDKTLIMVTHRLTDAPLFDRTILLKSHH